MATYTDSLGFDKGSAAMPAKGTNRSSIVSVVLDFPKIIAARAAAGAPHWQPFGYRRGYQVQHHRWAQDGSHLRVADDEHGNH
ncbi:hypothetical protein EJG08_13010, partial [Neisseria meningitidis]|nr:hypothetical protein [Neisseria meningitidis]